MSYSGKQDSLVYYTMDPKVLSHQRPPARVFKDSESSTTVISETPTFVTAGVEANTSSTTTGTVSTLEDLFDTLLDNHTQSTTVTHIPADEEEHEILEQSINLKDPDSPLVTLLSQKHIPLNDPAVRREKLLSLGITARALYNSSFDDIDSKEYLSYLGGGIKLIHESDLDIDIIRCLYMSNFRWSSNLLMSLRTLCDKLFFKGESQHIDKIIDSFSESWFQVYGRQNTKALFGNANGVYLIAYSLILLNTDLHTQNIEKKKRITRTKYVKNTILALHQNKCPISDQLKVSNELKMFYSSLTLKELRLLKDNPVEVEVQGLNLTAQVTGEASSAYPSSLKPPSYRQSDKKSIFSTVSHRQKAPVPPTIPEDKSFGFAKAILTEKKLKRMPSMQSARPGPAPATSIISDGRLSKLALSFQFTEGSIANGDNLQNEETFVIEEEGDLELELDGPPWAKEGLQNAVIGDEFSKGHSNWFSKKSSSKWKNTFTVASQGKIRLFSFDSNQKHGHKSSFNNVGSDAVTGDGSWYNQAKCLVSVNLCSCFAQFVDVESKLHAKLTHNYGYPVHRKTGYETFWVLNLPLTDSNSFSSYRRLYFCAGTSEIASEFVETCNFWSARSSSVPPEEPISSLEFGWSPKLVGMCDALNASSKNSSKSIEEYLNKTGFAKWQPTIYGLIPANFTMNEQLQKLRQHYQDLSGVYKQHKELEGHLEKLHVVFNRNNSTSSYYSHLNRFFGSGPKESKDSIVKTIKLVRLNYVNKLNYLENELLRYRKYISTLENAIKLRREKLQDSESTDL